MQKKKVIVGYDMDDTLCLTGQFINDDLTVAAKQHGLNDVEQFIRTNREHMSTMLYPPEIKKFVDKYVIGPGTYMLDAKPSGLMEAQILQKVAKWFKNHDVLQVVCSHRGFHEYGEIYTRQWLQGESVLQHIDDIHMLDGKTHPNKVDFLRAYYGEDVEIVLLDDNPLHDFNKEHEPVKEIMIYDRVHQFKGYQNQKRYTCMRSFFDHIETLLGV